MTTQLTSLNWTIWGQLIHWIIPHWTSLCQGDQVS